MPFCIYCGKEHDNGAKFCGNCGKPVKSTDNTENKNCTDEAESFSKRKTVYDGEVHKCPNCGELMKAFDGKCSLCGYEPRESKANSSAQELTEKLAEIETDNMGKRWFNAEKIKKEKKLNLIKTYPIPNTKADLFEYIFLAQSNIDIEAYIEDDLDKKEFSEAWRVKFEQAYQKSKVMFNNDDMFPKITELYNNTNMEIKKAIKKNKRNSVKWGIIGTLIFISVIALIFIIVSVFGEKDSDTDISSSHNRYTNSLTETDTITIQTTYVESTINNAAENALKTMETTTNRNLLKVATETTKNKITETQPTTYPELKDFEIKGTGTPPAAKEFTELIEEIKKACYDNGAYVNYALYDDALIYEDYKVTEANLYLEIMSKNDKSLCENMSKKIEESYNKHKRDFTIMIDYVDINKDESEANRVISSTDIYMNGTKW